MALLNLFMKYIVAPFFCYKVSNLFNPWKYIFISNVILLIFQFFFFKGEEIGVVRFWQRKKKLLVVTILITKHIKIDVNRFH